MARVRGPRLFHRRHGGRSHIPGAGRGRPRRAPRRQLGAGRAHVAESPPRARGRRPGRGRPGVPAGAAHRLWGGARDRSDAQGRVPARARADHLFRRRVRPGCRPARSNGCRRLGQSRPRGGRGRGRAAPARRPLSRDPGRRARFRRRGGCAGGHRGAGDDHSRASRRGPARGRPGVEGFVPPLGLPAQHGRGERARRLSRRARRQARYGLRSRRVSGQFLGRQPRARSGRCAALLRAGDARPPTVCRERVCPAQAARVRAGRAGGGLAVRRRPGCRRRCAGSRLSATCAPRPSNACGGCSSSWKRRARPWTTS